MSPPGSRPSVRAVSVMAIVTVSVLAGAAVISSVCVALVEHQRRRLVSTGRRLARFNAASDATADAVNR